MTLIVETINPETGETGEIRVEAVNALDAERVARERGLWVEAIRVEGVESKLAVVEPVPPAMPLARVVGRAVAQIRPAGDKPQLIEQTAKAYKIWMLIGGGLMLASIPMCCGAGMVGSAVPGLGGLGMVLSTLAFVVGLGIFIGARVMAWWNHG